MTELSVMRPALNSFVQRQMFEDAREILNHINAGLHKWGLSQYCLTGESIPFAVQAVQDFLEDIYESTDRKYFIGEYGPTNDSTPEARRMDGDLTMQHFLCLQLKNKFMQYAPPNTFRSETLVLEPAIKLFALQLLDKTIQ
jgi:hypothetical protein